MSSLLMTAWLLSVPVPDELATRKETPLTRAEIIKRLELAAVKPNPPTPLSELMAEAVTMFKEANRHPESFIIPANDPASETHFKKEIEDEQKKISLTQYKLSVMLDELLNEAETAKQDQDTQTRYRYICAHLEYRIGQMHQHNGMLGELRKEFPEHQAGDRRWHLIPARVDITDRDAAKNVGKARKMLHQLIKDHTASDWAKYAAEEDKGYFIGLKWAAEK